MILLELESCILFILREFNESSLLEHWFPWILKVSVRILARLKVTAIAFAPSLAKFELNISSLFILCSVVIATSVIRLIRVIWNPRAKEIVTSTLIPCQNGDLLFFSRIPFFRDEYEPEVQFNVLIEHMSLQILTKVAHLLPVRLLENKHLLSLNFQLFSLLLA